MNLKSCSGYCVFRIRTLLVRRNEVTSFGENTNICQTRICDSYFNGFHVKQSLSKVAFHQNILLFFQTLLFLIENYFIFENQW